MGPFISGKYKAEARLLAAGWTREEVAEVWRKAAESRKPWVYLDLAVRNAEIDAYRRREAASRREAAEAEKAAAKRAEEEKAARLLLEAGSLLGKLEREAEEKPSEGRRAHARHARLAVGVTLLGESHAVGSYSPEAWYQWKSRGVKALARAGASEELLGALRTAPSWLLK